MFRWARLGALLWAALALNLSCGGTQMEVDLGDLPSSASDSPRITAVSFLGQSAKASDVLIFEIDFDDADGDVGPGQLLTFINREETPFVERNLKLTFLQSELDPKAKQGSLRVVTQIAFLSPIQSGQRGPIEFSFQLKDAKGHASNKATARLVLEF